MESHSNKCCVSREATSPATPVKSAKITPATGSACQRDTVRVPGGKALLGTAHPILAVDGESPLREKRVKPLDWERGTVTVAAFRRFIDATGYQTEAERFGWSFVFYSHLPKENAKTLGIDGLEWWRKVDGATWAFPNGPHGAPAQESHPVVHVSWNDATAYAKWAGGRLPQEHEWEHAARGGLGDVPFPWGTEEPNDDTFQPCNIWQGNFPHENTCADGYAATAPAISFSPNGYGLYNMVGNVWEWTAAPFRIRTLKKTARQSTAAPQRLLKGGSFLCHISYCYRYRIAARTGNTPDSTSSHTGFRIVYPV
ncbi:formylglycine-generating enzyme family protein [Halocynthiibacter sp. C4]|uniref:formylglycine-generating enzyme family protein n=1 Tax=Halocynthiibacter sp. C4 TaxID=2992758 RepID=UPI00237ACD4C|nr:formylglycine-generating enzyme family protein [Halocynthiibacter sp. C4]MDE0589080.1 formylglycine-generating enzyme family protein [Halocynthiibacter sp. C4]